MSVSMKIAAKGVVALSVVTSLLAGGLVLAGGAQAAAPTFEPDPNSAGAVTLYNASGVQITSGSTTTAPFASYYAGSGGLIAGSPSNAGAQAYAATPQDGVNSQQWSSDTLSASTPIGPAVSANYPGALKNSDKAIAKATSDDFSLNDYIGEFPSKSTANPNVYQIRVLTGNPAKFYTMDVQVTGSTWTQVYPAPPPPPPSISTPVADKPSPLEVGPTVGLSATVTNPVAGSVHLLDDATDKGAVTYNAATGAITATDTPAVGTHKYKFTLTPTDTTVSAVSSATLTYVVTTVSVHPTTTVVSGPTTGTGGDTVTYTVTVKDSATSGAVASGTVQFQVDGSNAGSPVPVSNAGVATFGYNLPNTSSPATHVITAAYTATAANLQNSADNTGVTVTVNPRTTTPDPQDVVVNVPAGSLVISTPYTASNPFILGNLVLDPSGTGYTASADFGNTKTAAGNATADPILNGSNGGLAPGDTPQQVDSRKAAQQSASGNGITITDTRANSQGWNAFASTTDFTNPALDTPIDGNNLTFHDLKVKYVAGNAIQNGVAVSDIDHFKVAKKQFAANTNKKPGTVAIAGTLTLTAPTSTKAGQYTATITFTVV